MIGNGVHDGGVVDVLFQGCERTALTATVALFVAEPAGDVGTGAFATALAFALGLPLLGMLALSPVVGAAFVAKVTVAEACALVGLFALASLPIVLWWMAGWAPTRVLRGRWGGCAKTKTDTSKGLRVGVVYVSIWVWATVPGPGVRVPTGLASGRFRLEFLQSSFLGVWNAQAQCALGDPGCDAAVLFEFLGEVCDVVSEVLLNAVAVEIYRSASEKSTRFEDLNLFVC